MSKLNWTIKGEKRRPEGNRIALMFLASPRCYNCSCLQTWCPTHGHNVIMTLSIMASDEILTGKRVTFGNFFLVMELRVALSLMVINWWWFDSLISFFWPGSLQVVGNWRHHQPTNSALRRVFVHTGKRCWRICRTCSYYQFVHLLHSMLLRRKSFQFGHYPL